MARLVHAISPRTCGDGWPGQAGIDVNIIAAPVTPVSWPVPRAGPAVRPKACLRRPSTTGGAETGKIMDGPGKAVPDAVGPTAPSPSVLTLMRTSRAMTNKAYDTALTQGVSQPARGLRWRGAGDGA